MGPQADPTPGRGCAPGLRPLYVQSWPDADMQPPRDVRAKRAPGLSPVRAFSLLDRAWQPQRRLAAERGPPADGVPWGPLRRADRRAGSCRGENLHEARRGLRFGSSATSRAPRRLGPAGPGRIPAPAAGCAPGFRGMRGAPPFPISGPRGVRAAWRATPQRHARCSLRAHLSAVLPDLRSQPGNSGGEHHTWCRIRPASSFSSLLI